MPIFFLYSWKSILPRIFRASCWREMPEPISLARSRVARIWPSPAGGRLPQLLHGLAHLAAHHPLQFRDGAFHHARQALEGAPDGNLGLDGLEFALEALNLAQALADDRGVLVIELFQAVGLALVVVEVGSSAANSSA